MRELMNRIWKKEEGFSLIELIIVIAILAIIAAIAVPNLLSNIQRANESSDESNAKLIADAISTYIAQNPEYEGTTIGVAGTLVAFTNITPGATATDAELVQDGASAILSDVTPKVKNNDNGNDGNDFYILVDANGAVTVAEDAAGAHVVFP